MNSVGLIRKYIVRQFRELRTIKCRWSDREKGEQTVMSCVQCARWNGKHLTKWHRNKHTTHTHTHAHHAQSTHTHHTHHAHINTPHKHHAHTHTTHTPNTHTTHTPHTHHTHTTHTPHTYTTHTHTPHTHTPHTTHTPHSHTHSLTQNWNRYRSLIRYFLSSGGTSMYSAQITAF